MTQLIETVKSSLAVIAGINENIKRLNQEAKFERQKAIEPFLEALAKSGEVSIIVVRGYTPGFNDGEPCEHSADYWVNVKSIVAEDLYEGDYDFELPDDLLDGLEAEEFWDRDTREYVVKPGVLEANIKLCKDHGHEYAAPSKEIMNAISTLIFTTAEEENGTNYYVTYVLKDGKFERFSGEYDCGY